MHGNSSFRCQSEENASDPPPGTLSLVDEVELRDKVVHRVTRLRDRAQVRDQVHVVTLLHAHRYYYYYY